MKNKWNKKKNFLHRFDLSDAIFTMFKTNIHTDSILANRKKLFQQNILNQAIL